MARRRHYVYGLHAARQFIQAAPERILNIWVQQSLDSAAIHAIRDSIQRLGLRSQTAARASLDRMSGQQNHQGVLIEARVAARPAGPDLAEVLAQNKDKNPFYLVLDSVQDPHNLGACIRTAAAAGAGAVIINKDRAAGINATARKVASGAVEHVAVLRVVNLVRAIAGLKKAGVWIIGLAHDAPRSLYELDLKTPAALVMGGEASGLRAAVKKACDHLAAIPVTGNMPSLNVSVATGVALYEVVRQRGGC